MHGAPKPTKDRQVLALLLLILITGTLFRVAGLSSGYQRVEDVPVASQIQRNYQGDWRPDVVLYYPNFFHYVVALCLRCVAAFFRVVGVQRGVGLYPFSLDQILFVARLISALLGSATILLVFAIGRRLYDARRGLIASFLYSVAYIPILFSHQIVLDVPMTFFYAVSLYYCVLIAQRKRWSDYALAGLWGGLTVATKYNGVFVFAAIFLAHALTAPSPKRRIPRVFLDRNLLLAGAAGAAGFFIGHPFALLKFKTFLGASKLLLKIVHETEWFLTPIRPKTLVEYVAYNKYFLALKNILSAEGPVLFALILLGVVAVCLRRNRKTAWLFLSGSAYFLGALGFVGFSRYRDLSMFAVFYAFLGMFGLELIRHLRVKPKALRQVPAFIAAFALIALEFGAAAKSYYLWEDDTTEMAERWIRRNVPEPSYIGKEWFSPPLRGADYSYRTLNRPYLFSSGFAPYSRFDFLILSSAAYGLFFRNEKFYSDYLLPYRTVRREFETIKDFYFWDIEYKNPELTLYSTRRPAGKKQRLELPLAVAWDNPPREFECVDGSPYGKSIMGFYLDGPRRRERTIISRRKVPGMAVFVSGAEGEGEVEVSNSGQTKKLRVKQGRTAVLFFKPWPSFPFYKHLYRISVRGTDSLGAPLVRLIYDEFEMGSELLRLGDWRAARACFLEALKVKSPSRRDFEIYLDLAFCCRNLGLIEEAERYAEGAKESPFLGRYLGLVGGAQDEADWRRSFEKFTGLDLDLFESFQANRIRAAEFVPLAQGDRERLDVHAGEVSLVSPEVRLRPQRYRVELRFARPTGMRRPAPRLEIRSNDEAAGNGPAAPVAPGNSSQDGAATALFSVEGRSVGERVRFIVSVSKDERAAFEGLALYPDTRDFFRRKSVLVGGLLGVSAAGGR
jgi:hypothetical protein